MAKKRVPPKAIRGLAARRSRPPRASGADRLPGDIRSLIEQARAQVARTVNSAMVALYWQVGKRIREDILHHQRAEYGEEIVSSLATQLTSEYGRGFSRQNLFRMIQFAEAFPNEEIVSSLMRQLSWTHLIYIIPLDDPLKRDFYAEMCRLERWSARTLRQKINGMLFERTALSKKPNDLIRHELDALREEDKLTPDLVFRDPYLLGFLGLRDTYAEKDLGKRGIQVSSYLTEVLPKEQLQRKPHDAVRLARERLARQSPSPPRR